MKTNQAEEEEGENVFSVSQNLTSPDDCVRTVIWRVSLMHHMSQLGDHHQKKINGFTY